MKRIQITIIVFTAFLAAVLLHSQSVSNDEIRVAGQPYTPPETHAITVQTNIVTVDVVVRDDHGKPVAGLKKEDFVVFDSGKQQKISNFGMEEAAPAPVVISAPAHITPGAAPPPPPPPPPTRYIGFYFDDYNIQTSDLTPLRKAAKKFVDEHLEPTDKAAVFTSSTSVTQGFTNDRQKLLAAIDQVVSHYRTAGYGTGSCPHIDPYQAWQITQTNYSHSPPFDLAWDQAIHCNCPDPTDPTYPDCVNAMARLVQTQAQTVLGVADDFAFKTLDVLGDIIRYVGKMPGRRMLVMSSSGYFSMSNAVKRKQDKLIDDALHSGIRINTLDAKGLAPEWVGGNPADGAPIVLNDGSLNAYAFQVAE
ncbi:MAG TPA: VWA domain-containing protein, partial [Candidatus Acidoferrum sp.]|nr:VWA domain-containing protein [Candidatus Acidoferrum sp.]